jgi:hypothetical protein
MVGARVHHVRIRLYITTSGDFLEGYCKCFVLENTVGSEACPIRILPKNNILYRVKKPYRKGGLFKCHR